MGCPTGAGTAAGVSQAADGKDLGEVGQAGREAKRVTAGESVLVVLFRIVLITPTAGEGRDLYQALDRTQKERKKSL